MSNEQQELILKLQTIEAALQEQDQDALELKTVVNELKNIVRDLDKGMAIQSEKQSHLFYRVEQLQKEIEIIEASGDRTQDKQRDLVEKALMIVLGGLISYLLGIPHK